MFNSIFKILVVEDCQSQREMIVSLLKNNHFQIATACNGLDAIAQVKLMLPDLVISDIVMPSMNGYDLCRQLKTNPQTKHIHVIICSTKSTIIDHHWGFKQGADAYINKPFTPKDLVDTVKELLKIEEDLVSPSTRLY